MDVYRFPPPLYIEHKVFYEKFTFVEADRLEKAVQVLALEDVVDVSEPGFLHDFERGIKLDGFRHEEAAVESVQVLLRNLRIGSDGSFRSLRVVSEEDWRDAGQEIVFEILGLELPLSEDHCGRVVPGR